MRFAAILLCCALTASVGASAAERPNVLLICVDDLKPLLGCYGDKTVKSPNIDRLAARGVLFERAYCNQAVCAPSRNALLTGLRPQSLGIYDLGTNFRRAAPDAVTLPQHFKRNGYRTEALGKIFHVGHGNTEDPASWSAPHFAAKSIGYALPENRAKPSREGAMFANKNPAGLPKGAAYERADVPDETYGDGKIADEAVRRLRAAAESPDEPFFLAVGFLKPHLPFCAPRKYWDLYDPADFQLADVRQPPEGAPPYAPQFGGELRNYAGIPEKGALPDDLQRTLIHGYHACVSYMDAQLGRVLDALDETGLADETIIVLWGDHGWHLGDHGMWCKHTNYEQAARVPLLVVAPGVTGADTRTSALIETVDIYPTLAELAGLPAPDGIDGRSFAPVLKDPESAGRDSVIHVYPRGGRIGRAIRTERHRLVEWKNPGAPADTAEFELYDYQSDPAETRNLAADRPEVVAELRAVLEDHPEAKPQLRDRPAEKPAQPKRQAATGKRPDVVLFLADDLGWADCSVYVDSGVRTPFMARLAADGMTFTHAFVASPSCAPSRAALLTGLNPVRNGAMLNHARPRADLKTWPAYFRELGYEVAAIGKVAHYGQVREYGFDHVSHFNYHQDDCVEAAVTWLEQRQSNKPLCLLVGTNWPHVPWPQQTTYDPDRMTPPPTVPDTRATREALARYAAAVENADRDLGRVYDAARQRLGKDTLFIFTSDHGAQFPFGKWNGYDAGIRTPLIVAWPGQVKPGSTSDALVSWIDLLPTCLAAAGAKPPAGGAEPGQISGRSFLPVLRGRKDEHRERIFITHSGDGEMNRYPLRAVRTHRWKYIRNLDPDAEYHSHVDLGKAGSDGRDYWDAWAERAESDPAVAAFIRRYHTRPAEELYDLGADPWEQTNLAGDPAHAETLRELRRDLDRWMQAQGDEGLKTERSLPDPRAKAKEKT